MSDNPAVVRLTELVFEARNWAGGIRAEVRGTLTSGAGWLDRMAQRARLLDDLADGVTALLASHAALTDRLARAEADGMLKAAKLECGRCGSDDPILLNPTPKLFGRYHPLPDREGKTEYLYCRASAIHAALASAPPPEGT